MIRERFHNRLNSDRADSLSVSQILWIGVAVVLVLGAGYLIVNAVMKKAHQTADCINNSNTTYGNGSANSACGFNPSTASSGN